MPRKSTWKDTFSPESEIRVWESALPSYMKYQIAVTWAVVVSESTISPFLGIVSHVILRNVSSDSDSFFTEASTELNLFSHCVCLLISGKMEQPEPKDVHLYIYDLTKGLARQLSLALLSKFQLSFAIFLRLSPMRS